MFNFFFFFFYRERPFIALFFHINLHFSRLTRPQENVCLRHSVVRSSKESGLSVENGKKKPSVRRYDGVNMFLLTDAQRDTHGSYNIKFT